MDSDNKIKIVVLVSVSAIAFTVGRYTVPTKVRIETKIVEVEKKTTDSESSKHKETEIITIKNPDGSEKTTTKIIEDSNKQKKTESDSAKNTNSSTETTKSGPSINLAALGGWDLSSQKPVYGALVSKQILGPVTIGAFGLSNGSVGGSVGVQF